MFNKAIYETALTGEVADRLFSNIHAQGAPDSSFLATMRVLLRKRLPQDKTARLTVRPLHMSRENIENSSLSANMNAVIPDGAKYAVDSEHNVFIVYNNHSPDAGEKMLDIIRANAGIGKRYMSEIGRAHV